MVDAEEEQQDLKPMMSASTVVRPAIGRTSADQVDAAVTENEVAPETVEADLLGTEEEAVAATSEEEAEADPVKEDLKSSEKADASSAERKDISRGTAQTPEEAADHQ